MNSLFVKWWKKATNVNFDKMRSGRRNSIGPDLHVNLKAVELFE